MGKFCCPFIIVCGLGWLLACTPSTPAPAVAPPEPLTPPPEVPSPPVAPSWAWPVSIQTDADATVQLGLTMDNRLTLWDTGRQAAVWQRLAADLVIGPPVVWGHWSLWPVWGGFEVVELTTGESVWRVADRLTLTSPNLPVLAETAVSWQRTGRPEVWNLASGVSLWSPPRLRLPPPPAVKPAKAKPGTKVKPAPAPAPTFLAEPQPPLWERMNPLLGPPPAPVNDGQGTSRATALPLDEAAVNRSGGLWCLTLPAQPLWLSFTATKARTLLWSSPTAEETPVKLTWLDDHEAELASNLSYGRLEAQLTTKPNAGETIWLKLEAANPAQAGATILLQVQPAANGARN